MSSDKVTDVEKKPTWHPFCKTRGGVVLTKEEVKEIKAGRKKLRKDMRAVGIKSKYEFEVTASSLGLYFDKKSNLLMWFFRGRGLAFLLGTAAALMLTIFGIAIISQMRGYFTVNLSEHMFRHGFTLSETEDFAQPAINLFAEPKVDAPCISITSLQTDIDSYEGQHNGFGYFAYTYFLRNEGVETVNYHWALQVTGEGLDCSKAIWIMVIEDGKMQLFAEPDANGEPQTVPARGDDAWGFISVPVMELAENFDSLMETITTINGVPYYRITPTPFQSETLMASGYRTDADPMEIHKYTVVIWLEGDDPDCTDELIGGHIGLQMQYILDEETEDGEDEGNTFWENLWDLLIFWKD